MRRRAQRARLELECTVSEPTRYLEPNWLYEADIAIYRPKVIACSRTKVLSPKVLIFETVLGHLRVDMRSITRLDRLHICATSR